MYFLFETYLLLSILLFLIFGISYSFSSNIRFPYLENNLFFLTMIICINSCWFCLDNSILEVSLFNNLLIKDGTWNLICLFITILNIISLIVTRYYNKTLYIISFEFYFLILFLIFNSSLIIAVNNLFLFFLFLEIQSIILFILSSINKRSRYSIESSLKYFILGSFSSIIMLLGISLVYISTSFLFFDDLNIFFYFLDLDRIIGLGIKFAISFILIGFLFKLYSAPFHFWVADIYQGSANSSVIIFLSSSAFVFFLLFVKLFFFVFYSFFNFYSNYLLFFSILSLFFGTIGGLLQKRIKRILAYSSITSIGYLFLTLISDNLYSLDSSFFFFINYIITSLGIFILFSSIFIRNVSFINFISQLVNFIKFNRLMSFLLGSFFFSIGGIPPFIGFIAKFNILINFFFTKFYGCFFLFLIVSTISFLYYARIIKFIFTKKITMWITCSKIDYVSSVITFFIFIYIVFSLIYIDTINLFCKLISINVLLS